MYRVLILISAVEISAKFLTGLTMILDGFCADAMCVGGLALNCLFNRLTSNRPHGIRVFTLTRACKARLSLWRVRHA